MQAQMVFQNLLREELLRIQAGNSHYSLRAYAKKTGIHVGALSSIMNGRRNVSRKLAERALGRLMLDPQKRSEILSLFPTAKRAKVTPPVESDVSYEPRYLELSAQTFRVIADWEHFAMLCLLKLKDFSPRAEWIQDRLGISKTRVVSALKRLHDLKLFETTSDGEIKRTTQSLRTSDDVAEISIKKSHAQSLELARLSLQRDPVDARDFTTLTMAIDARKLGLAKERIRKFQDELSELLETSDPTEVYRLSIQLFPLNEHPERKSP
ncbi:MAG: TIGR02147 family protein [Proteobacteria bacterium]|nr:MAG: TIGR02147 family protein [Pseudomonadota bacterium]